MLHTAALITSLASLGLVCAIYFCNILSAPDSRWRSEMLAMIMLSLLTGLFPLAATASVQALWMAVAGGLSLTAVVSAGADLVSIGAVLATVIVFRMLVKATYSTNATPNNVTPLTPRPVATGGRSGQRLPKAA